MRSSEHAAHRLLMHMCSYIALVAQVSPCVSFHVFHACAPVFGCLSVFSLHPSLYFFLKSFFHLFLMSTLVPDENSMKDPLCDSSFVSMVTLDYVTPDTRNGKRRQQTIHVHTGIRKLMLTSIVSTVAQVARSSQISLQSCTFISHVVFFFFEKTDFVLRHWQMT